MRGEVSGRKPGSEGESGASFQPAEIRAARFVDLAPSEQFGAHEPPHRKGVGKIGSRVHRRTLQIVVLRHAVDFHAQDVVEYNNDDYMVMIPLDDEEIEDDDEQDEVVILKVIREGDEETYSGVEDEDVLNAVFEIFQEQNAEEDED